MNNKHTPGPWHVRDGVIISESPHVRHCEPDQVPRMNGHIVARVQNDETGDYRNFPKETSEANARLIAASPELLDKLESLLQHFINVLIDDDDTEEEIEAHPVVIETRAALAKAKGE